MYRKNTASQFIAIQGVDATTGGIKSGVTWTVRRCIDGTFAAATGTATEDSTNGWYKFAMSQADTNGNNIQFNFTGTGAVPQTVNIITDGSPPDVNLKNAAGTAVTLDANNVLNVSTKYIGGTLQTARDIGASVLLSAGSGTGQLDFTSGVVKSNLAQILGTALTETAGQIAAAFKKFFNIASPTSTMNEITLVDTVTTYTGNTPQTGDVFGALPTHFSSLGISAGGHISNVDTLTTYTGDTPQTGDVYALMHGATTEPASVPAATAGRYLKIDYLFTKTRNKSTQTATTQTLLADDNSTTIGTVTVSDDGTTWTKGKDS